MACYCIHLMGLLPARYSNQALSLQVLGWCLLANKSICEDDQITKDCIGPIIGHQYGPSLHAPVIQESLNRLSHMIRSQKVYGTLMLNIREEKKVFVKLLEVCHRTLRIALFVESWSFTEVF